MSADSNYIQTLFNMKKITILVFTKIFFFGCGTTKNMSVIKYFPPIKEDVKILGAGQNIPDNAILIGNITIGDTGFTSAKNCTYAKVIQEATEMAQKMGGNLLYVVSHKEPDFECTRHRINAKVYRIKND